MVNQVLYTLASGLVLDNSVLGELTVDETTQTIQTIRAAGDKPLIVIDGADAFFTQAKLVDFIAHKDAKALLVNEQIDLFNIDQMNLLLGNHPDHQPLPAQGGDGGGEGEVIVGLGKPAPIAANGGYTYAMVPAGWSVGTHMSLGPTKIKRKLKNADGDGIMFYMGPTDFEKLWLYASKAWSGEDCPPIYFNTGMGKKLAHIQDDRISIGGNYIRRFEIEQVAKYRGWQLPAGVKVAA